MFFLMAFREFFQHVAQRKVQCKRASLFELTTQTTNTHYAPIHIDKTAPNVMKCAHILYQKKVYINHIEMSCYEMCYIMNYPIS